MPLEQAIVIESSSVPHFLLKVWKLLEDESLHQCVGWDETGFSFSIKDPFIFSRDVLPQYFKHNNVNSFVRQLNMYGFRKVANIDKSGLRFEHENLEFQHPYFVRGHPELLQYIKRKVSAPKGSTELEIQKGPQGMNQLLEEVHYLREKQGKMSAKLTTLEKNNAVIWREVAYMRQQHLKQKAIVGKLFNFLASMVQSPSNHDSRKRLGKRPLYMLTPGESNDLKRLRQTLEPSNSSAGAVIHDITDEELSMDELAELGFMMGNGDDVAGGSGQGPQEYAPNAGLKIKELSPRTMTPTAGVVQGIPSMSPPTSQSTGVWPEPLRNESLQSVAISPPPLQAPVSLGGVGRAGAATSGGGFGFAQGLQQPQSSSTFGQAPIDRNLPDDWLDDGNAEIKKVLPDAARPLTAAKRFVAAETEYSRDSQTPEFNDYLDFMEDDLDSLRDLLVTNGSFKVEPDMLTTLFSGNEMPFANSQSKGKASQTNDIMGAENEQATMAVVSRPHGMILPSEFQRASYDATSEQQSAFAPQPQRAIPMGPPPPIVTLLDTTASIGDADGLHAAQPNIMAPPAVNFAVPTRTTPTRGASLGNGPNYVSNGPLTTPPVTPLAEYEERQALASMSRVPQDAVNGGVPAGDAGGAVPQRRVQPRLAVAVPAAPSPRGATATQFVPLRPKQPIQLIVVAPASTSQQALGGDVLTTTAAAGTFVRADANGGRSQ